MCTPRAEKKFGAKFTGESVIAVKAEQESNFFEEIVEIWTVGVVNLVVLACVLRATTKKVVNFLDEEKCTPRENPGYSYETK